MTIEPTPLTSLLRAQEIALQKLYYVYLGNTHSREGSNTYCPRCENLLVSRSAYIASIVGIKDDRCDNCGRKVDMVL